MQSKRFKVTNSGFLQTGFYKKNKNKLIPVVALHLLNMLYFLYFFIENFYKYKVLAWNK